MERNVSSSKTVGFKKLIQVYRKAFRIPENLDYYSEENFKRAERHYIKQRLSNGNANDVNTSDDPGN